MDNDITAYIEPVYKEYSMEANSRSFPSLEDGLKESQRKVIFIAEKRAQNFIKVTALQGYVTAEAHYNHGDVALNNVISLMGQDFTGSNNYPLLEGKGGFGNKFGAKCSQARYIYVKLSKYFKYIFREEDRVILESNNDIEYPEPKFYMPIVPYVLMNGSFGVGVGYASDIPPYDMNQVIENIENILNNKKKRVDVHPFFKGYKGKIVNENDKWVMYGVFERLNTTTIKITEVPVGVPKACLNQEQFKENLNSLIDADIIKDYEDLSDSDWCFIIKAPREFVSKTDEEIYSILKLKVNIPTNLNLIFNNNVKTYNSPIEIIEDFVPIRMKYYEKRKNNILLKHCDVILKTLIKLYINRYVIDRKEKKLNKEEILMYMDTCVGQLKEYFDKFVKEYKIKFDNKSIREYTSDILEYLKLSDVYNDKIKFYQEKIKEETEKHNILNDTDIVELYKRDLKDLKKVLLT